MVGEHPFRTAVLAATLVLLCGGPVGAGDSKAQFTLGSNFFDVQPACRVKQFPTLESVTPLPRIIDPFEKDLIPIFCDLEITRQGKGVRGAKGRYEADLVVVDNNTGEAESFPVGSGKFKTNSSGRASFDFEVPSEIFADGFESGDVSAWSYTRTDFTNRKRATTGAVTCGTSSSSTGG